MRLGISALIATALVSQCAQASELRVFSVNPEALVTARDAFRADPVRFQTLPGWTQFSVDSKAWLPRNYVTVISKTQVPPSGDKRDFLTMSPYKWPNPDTPDGLPYITIDGVTNPESKNYPDHANLVKFTDTVETMALNYFYTGDPAYAVRAASWVKKWFKYPDTRMNPNLQYSMWIPGTSSGTTGGLLEALYLIRIIDAIGLIDGSGALTSNDLRVIKDWFRSFTVYMRTSKFGLNQAFLEANNNNHATYYDATVVSMLLFLDDPAGAAAIIEEAKWRRLDRQLSESGEHVKEMNRSLGLYYSESNLNGMLILSEQAKRVGIDLYHYTSPTGRSIEKSVNYLKWYADYSEPWPLRQISPIASRYPLEMFLRAYQLSGDSEMLVRARSLPDTVKLRWWVLMPPPPDDRLQ